MLKFCAFNNAENKLANDGRRGMKEKSSTINKINVCFAIA